MFVMKPEFIILGIVLCVLSSAPLKADPDVSDSATISGTYERSSKSVPKPGILTLLTVGVLTLIVREKVKFDRGHKDKQKARMEVYWQALKKERPSEQRMELQQEKQLNGHKTKYLPLENIPSELLPPNTKQKPPAKGPQMEEAGVLLNRRLPTV